MDDIIKWASEIWGAHIKWGPGQIARLEKFHEKVIEAEQKKMQLWHDAVKEQHRMDILAEREACAELCFHSPPEDEYESPLAAVYKAIRNRSNP